MGGVVTMADGSVTLPGIGPVKKTTALIGGVGVVAIVATMYIRQKRNAASGAAVPGTDQPIDPVTGYPYGSPQDTAALALQATGSSTVTGSGGGDGVGDTSGNPDTSLGGIPSFRSNAEWAQYVEQYMVNNQGADASTIGNVIGKYLTGQPIPDAQRQIIDTAVGIANYPPISGVGGYPPSIHIQAAAPTPVPTFKFVQQNHAIAKPEAGLSLISRFSDKGASISQLQSALAQTVAHLSAAQKQYYAAHSNTFPIGLIHTTVVVKG